MGHTCAVKDGGGVHTAHYFFTAPKSGHLEIFKTQRRLTMKVEIRVDRERQGWTVVCAKLGVVEFFDRLDEAETYAKELKKSK